jgi:hypothetical protein
MEAILKFDLNVEEDKNNFEMMQKSPNMASALFEIINNSRKLCEQKIELSDTAYTNDDILDVVFETIADIIHENELFETDFN